MNKIVFITGINSDIGICVAKEFIKHGWFIIGSDVNDENIFTDIIKYYKCDLTDILEVENMCDNLIEYKNIASIINIASIQDNKHITDVTYSDFDKSIACNVKSPYFICKKMLSILENNKGTIVNVSSICVDRIHKNFSIYTMTKSAILGMTKSLAVDLAKYKIRVNCVSPGTTCTKGLLKRLERLNNPDIIKNIEKKMLLKKMCTAENIAKAIYFLADNNFSENTTGSVFTIDGGETISTVG